MREESKMTEFYVVTFTADNESVTDPIGYRSLTEAQAAAIDSYHEGFNEEQIEADEVEPLEFVATPHGCVAYVYSECDKDEYQSYAVTRVVVE